jgi:UDP-N-acetyl-D-glucosamine dehydrogenase
VCRGINQGRSHIGDIADAELAPLVADEAFRATTDSAAIAGLDAVVICVPTPLGKMKDPDISCVKQAIDSVVRHAGKGMLVVLESTTYPGTTEELLVPRLAEEGLVAGQDVFVAFSPERIDPGNTKFRLANTPKVVGGLTPRCTELAALLYGAAVERVVEVSSPRAAEMAKLFENTFRAVNIGLANELAIMCDKIGVDVWEVIDAASSKPFGFMRFTPGPGLGGHCIPIDPLYLSWKLRGLNYVARFIELASDVNSHMPHFVVDKAMDALNRRGRCMNGAQVLVLGVAYKKDVRDMRESPALDVISLLQQKGAEVSYHDPFVPKLEHHGLELSSVSAEPTPDVSAADLVVIITDHSGCDYARVCREAKLVLDCRNATKDVVEGREKVVKL